jgi:hypothetical protein
VHIGEPLKTIVVEPLEISVPILTPESEPEPLRDARVPQNGNCCPQQVRSRFLAIHTGTYHVALPNILLKSPTSMTSRQHPAASNYDESSKWPMT